MSKREVSLLCLPFGLDLRRYNSCVCSELFHLISVHPPQFHGFCMAIPGKLPLPLPADVPVPSARDPGISVCCAMDTEYSHSCTTSDSSMSRTMSSGANKSDQLSLASHLCHMGGPS